MSTETLTRTSEFERIARKVRAGERLTFDEGLALYQTPDLLALGALANEMAERRTGKKVYFVVNRHINPTNICYVDCTFCSFDRKPGEEGGYVMSMEQIVGRARQAEAMGITEIHIVGGLYPKLGYDWYLDVLRQLRQACPRIHLKAYTAVEVEFLARIGRKTFDEVLADLREAGLGSLPGGGAEIFAERVRKETCANKADADTWLEIHRRAHRMGIRSTATMLFGTIETVEERIDHLLRLRALQDETSGFECFIPLAFHPDNNALAHRGWTTGFDDLKTIAVSRLLLDNFRHIKAYWIMLGEKIAQVALAFGANDLDGTVVEERIVHMAGAQSPQEIQKQKLIGLIRDAGKVPVQRDTLYQELEVFAAAAA